MRSLLGLSPFQSNIDVQSLIIMPCLPKPTRRNFLVAAASALQLCGRSWGAGHSAALPAMLSGLRTSVLFAGDENTAYRDPAALYHGGYFYLYFTFVQKLEDGIRYSSVAWSRSRDLRHWSDPVRLTPQDKRLDYGSPGSIVRFVDQWVLCLQTYPRPNGERYGNGDSRLWTMTSHDLQTWSAPTLLRVKGAEVPVAEMGRIIDPYLLQDKDMPSKWWCFYKQNGISRSWSHDLEHWTYAGTTAAGENPCIILDKNEYVLFHSPRNGIGVKRSADLLTWTDGPLITLGQNVWPWANYSGFCTGSSS